MLGILMSVVAGAAMSVQGVINTRLSEKIGLYESNLIVQATAFALGLLAVFLLGKGDYSALSEVNKFYFTGGIFGFVITVSVMLSIGHLTPTVAISIILVSQLLVAAAIDGFGLLGSEKIPFTLQKYMGLGLMLSGMLLFKWERT